MKLIRWGEVGHEKPGVVIGEKCFDVAAFGEDFNGVFFESDGINRLKAFINANEPILQELPVNVRFAEPVSQSSKIICVGLNYIDHAKESGMDVPVEPVLFFKSTTAIIGPFDDIVIPKTSEKTDWEVELAVVIGKRASYIDEADAMEYVAGYCLHNDVSERAFQLERGGQWVKGKSCDTFAPLGPWIVTPDEITDVHNLPLWLKVNGVLMQSSNTRNLIFSIPFLIHYISQFMTLLPGDILSTGTPPGVGFGLKPPVYLKPGDVIELGIDGLGVSKQVCKHYKK